MFDREVKFVLPEARASDAARVLAARCRPDPVYPASRVSSIYFDTPEWRALREKWDGDFLKTKVRLRWYGDRRSGEPAGPGFLEVKRRQGAGRTKQRIALELDARALEGMALSDPRLLRLPERLRRQGVAVPSLLAPVFLVRYARLRFVEPGSGARISLDSAIEVPRVNPARLPRPAPVALSVAVVEVKGRGDRLPETLSLLSALGCVQRAFSKYAACFERLWTEPGEW